MQALDAPRSPNLTAITPSALKNAKNDLKKINYNVKVEEGARGLPENGNAEVADRCSEWKSVKRIFAGRCAASALERTKNTAHETLCNMTLQNMGLVLVFLRKLSVH